MAPLSPSRRKLCDFTKLMVAGYEIDLNDGNAQDFFVTFHGPKGTAYEGGVWRIHVVLPDDYPFVSPSIGFVNKILHPNIDEVSGTVCLDVINQTWTPIYSLVNVFEIFLPQLLRYPNAADPLNAEAGSLMLRDERKYEEKIREYVKNHATNLSSTPQLEMAAAPELNPTCSSSSSNGFSSSSSPTSLPSNSHRREFSSKNSVSDLSDTIGIDENDDLSDF